jgi:ATP-dependent protease ClpP protease subunit
MTSIRLYGLIGKDALGQGTSADEMISRMPSDGSPIEVRINSEGGSVVEGFAIANALYSYKGETVAIVEGQASSAASYVAASCRKIKMYRASYMVVHGPWDPRGGSMQEHQQMAADLERMGNMMRALYRRRGVSDKQIDEWFAGGDHVLTPEEAMKVGLCDKIIEENAVISAAAKAQILAKVKRPLRAERKPMEEYASMDKKALKAAYKNEADESKKAAIAKALAEKEDTTTGEGMQGRVNAEADKDPAVKALVAQLAGERKAAMDAQAKLGEVAERLAKIEEERDVAAFVAESRDVYADDEARAQYQALGGSVARAMVAELRKKGVSMASMFRGGNPPGKLPIGSTNVSSDGLTMYQGMAYRDIDIAARASQIRAELRAKDSVSSNADIATRALRMALAEKGR